MALYDSAASALDAAAGVASVVAVNGDERSADGAAMSAAVDDEGVRGSWVAEVRACCAAWAADVDTDDGCGYGGGH